MTGFGESPSTTKRPWTKPKWSTAESLWEEIDMLLHNRAFRCIRCKRTTDLDHLDDDQRCPDCRGKESFQWAH